MDGNLVWWYRCGFAQVRRWPSFNLIYAHLSYTGRHLFFKSLPHDYPRSLKNLSCGPIYSAEDETKTRWCSLEGDSEILTNAIHTILKTKPLYLHRVISISASQDIAFPQTMKITVAGHPEISGREYSHVVSTVPVSCLR